MKKEIVAISKNNHKNFSFRSIRDFNSDFSYFKKFSTCPIVIDEIKHIAGNYPIVFTKNKDGNFNIECMFSLLKESNILIDSQNRWLGSYIPVLFRLHPFLLAKPAKDKSDVLCFISNSSAIEKSVVNDYVPFFDKKGSVSKELETIIQILKAVKINHKKTAAAIHLLRENQILSKWDINLRFKDGDKKIEGLYQINEEKLKNLKSEILFESNKIGALDIAYAQVISKQKLGTLANLHVKIGNLEQPPKSMRDIAIEKQTKEKKKELDDLVLNLFDSD